MKTSLLLPAFLCVCTSLAAAQELFIYDQQAGPEDGSPSTWSSLQETQPMGQSFTPSLGGIGFVTWWVHDFDPNGIGSTLTVRLHTYHIAGPVFAESDPLFLPDSFMGQATLTFRTQVPLTPGTLYFMQPWVATGDRLAILGYSYGYEGGTAYAKGTSYPSADLWFREGIIVPEPGTGAVLGLGLGLLAWVRRPRTP